MCIGNDKSAWILSEIFLSEIFARNIFRADKYLATYTRDSCREAFWSLLKYPLICTILTKAGMYQCVSVNPSISNFIKYNGRNHTRGLENNTPKQMKLVFHTEMLPRVMLKHMYNFSNVLSSCLCSVKFWGQAHTSPLPPSPTASSNQHPVHTSSLESLERYTTLSCERVAAE